MFKKKISVIIIFCGILFVFFAGGVFLHYHRVYLSPNIFVNEVSKTDINISDKISTTDEVIAMLSEKAEIKNSRTLKKAIKKFEYISVRSGHYEIRNGMNNKELVQMLQRGLQTPVRVTFNNIRTKEQLAASLSKQLMPDSLSIITLLNDSAYLAIFDLNIQNVLVAFIPNTYEFFWNVDEKQMFERFHKEYLRFWNEERLKKSAAIPLNSVEVSILAAIVDEETNKMFEYPIVAGLYINRLKKRMLLQADPTVKYAVGDFGLRRVLKLHLETDSPYNTYKYHGLPPGPIRIPSIQAIDAVLNYQKHNYLYMAAKETLNGEHNFATTLNDHNKNARKYQRALNELRIYH